MIDYTYLTTTDEIHDHFEALQGWVEEAKATYSKLSKTQAADRFQSFTGEAFDLHATVKANLNRYFADHKDALDARLIEIAAESEANYTELPDRDMDGSHFQLEPTDAEVAEYETHRARVEKLPADLWAEVQTDEISIDEAEAEVARRESQSSELTGDNAIDYDLTTVEGILHALKDGVYLGGPAQTTAQRKNLRSKLRKLGYRLSDHKTTIEQREAQDNYEELKAAHEYQNDGR